MSRVQVIVIVALTLAAGAGSFLLGRRGGGDSLAAHPRPATCPGRLGPYCNECEALADCLRLSPAEAQAMAKADPNFAPEANALRGELDRRRDALAALLEDAAVGDDILMRQVERVIEAHDALERRVARHVLAIRKLLTPPQARRLMGLAARSVRSGGTTCSGSCRDCASGG